MDGILNVNKPAGWTSFDVVAFVRRGSRVRRVGHAGTLDPAATGVLPVCLGRATRVIEYLVDARKTYVASVRLGVETDTYDAEGDVVAEQDASGIDRGQVEAALAPFRGLIRQTAPPYSALKQDGVPLYKHARAGRPVEPRAREVTIYRLALTAFEPPLLRLEIECSKGTYVRSIAHDLGRALGVGGSLAALSREQVGPFSLATAVDPETLRAEFVTGRWARHLIAADEVLLDWPAAIFDQPHAAKLMHGSLVELTREPPLAGTALCRAYTTAGDFLAVLRRRAGDAPLWHPEKVFPVEPA